MYAIAIDFDCWIHRCRTQLNFLPNANSLYFI